MRNKSKNMYGRLAAILLTVVLLTAGLSCTALAAGENILSTIQGFDPDFEAPLPEDTTWVKKSETAAIVDGGHESNQSLKLTAKGDNFVIIAPVEPAKNYNFSFWMKNSEEGALQLQGGYNLSEFLAPGGKYNNGGSSGTYFYSMANVSSYPVEGEETERALDWRTNGINTYVGYGEKNTNAPLADYTYGIARTEADSNVWRQVTINFTTPPELVAYVRLVLACVVDNDPVLAIDDLSLVDTERDPNFIYNGNMEAVREDKDVSALTAFFTPSASDTSNPKTEIVTDSATNNKYLRIYDLTVAAGKTRANWSLTPSTALYTKGTRLGTRYKISFRAKAEAAPGANDTFAVSVRPSGYNSTNKWNQDYTLGTVSNEWKTYTMYIDSTKAAANGVILDNKTFTMMFPYYIYPNYAIDIDDVTSWYDKSNIGFFKALDVNYADAEKTDRYFDFTPNYANDKGDVYKDIMMTESGIEAPSISDLTLNGDGSRTVITRAHYLPEAKWGTENGATTVSFDETTVTLLSAVYMYETDSEGKKIVDTKKLVGIDIDSATTNGETIDVVGEITIPKVEGTECYEVEAMAWDMDSMKPIIDADKEQRTLKFE